MKDTYCVMTFHSTYYALQFEKLLKENNLNVRLIPVPRQISTSCGIAGEISCADQLVIEKLCDENNLEYGAFHTIEKEVKKSWYRNLVKK